MAWFGNWKVEVDNDESFIVFQKKETSIDMTNITHDNISTCVNEAD